MSTASDGYRREREPHDIRQKYKEQKQKLASMDKQLLDSEYENRMLKTNLANSDAEVLHLQNVIESVKAHDHQHRKNLNAFHEFDKVIRFLEASLQLIPPGDGNENTIQNRLLTIITHLGEKEASFAEENQKLKAQIEKLKKPSEANNSLEATLTRVMKQHEAEMASTQADLSKIRDQQKQTEANWHKAKDELELRVDRLRVERNTAELNLRESRSQVDDLSKALTRAEKAKNSMMTSRDGRTAELAKLQKEYNDKVQSSRAEQTLVNDLQKELEDLRRMQSDTRGRSRIEDTEALSQLSDQLQSIKNQLLKSEQSNEEKDATISLLKSKIKALQDDNSDELKQLGKLQEEIAGKDLLLANAKSVSAGFESTAKLAMRERGAAIQRASLEVNVWRTRLAVANSTNEERLKECDFLKESIEVLEKKNYDNSILRRKELDVSRQKDNQVASLQSRLTVLENQVETFTENEISYKRIIDDYQMKVLGKSSADMSKIHTLQELRNQVYKAIGNQSQCNGAKLEEENQQPTEEHIYEELVLLTRKLIEQIEVNKSAQRRIGESEGGNEDQDKIVKMKQELDDITKTLSKEREENMQLHVVIKEWKTSSKPKSDMVEHEMESDETQLTTEDKDLESNIAHILALALARTSTLEEHVVSLEEEIVELKRVYDELAAIEEEMKGTIDSMDSEISWKNSKISQLEKDLDNRKQDLLGKIDELVDAKTRLQEQSSKSDILEEERNGLKHHIDLLERLKAEQQEQLEGRERALKRLDDARRTYEKMYEAKIETLKEERTVTERTALAEFTKIQSEHEQELQDALLEWNSKFAQAKVSHDSVLEAYKDDKAVVELERNGLIKKVAELDESLQKSVKDIEERNLLLSGYMALVSEKQAEGMFQEGSEIFQNLLEQRRIDMDTFTELTEEIQKLKMVMDDQYNLMRRYDQDMTNLANRNELFIRQGREREQELILEKKARHRDQNQFKTLLAERDKAIMTLENAISRMHGSLKVTEPLLIEDSREMPPVLSATTHEGSTTATTHEESTTATVVNITGSPRHASSNASDDMDIDP
ncbi:hypothetical protein BGZ76_003374 [Entomortierella beljakovae]|nr:hypothetical protein BGZ76_003374 [Entomortierella beljakovae]